MHNRFRRYFAGAALALVGAVLMACGIARGEMAVVLAKATRICLECIGIG
ncbi:MAG: CD1871A family CXXC motif-containing protein [Eubacteriales bacterium]|nr:CD1871A family CXXC motif-containing protein [Eubacteriales bacterium]